MISVCASAYSCFLLVLSWGKIMYSVHLECISCMSKSYGMWGTGDVLFDCPKETITPLSSHFISEESGESSCYYRPSPTFGSNLEDKAKGGWPVVPLWIVMSRWWCGAGVLRLDYKFTRNWWEMKKNGSGGIGYFGLNLWRSSQKYHDQVLYVFYHEVVAKWYYGW